MRITTMATAMVVKLFLKDCREATLGGGTACIEVHFLSTSSFKTSTEEGFVV
jgi:hypothetical protein